MLPFLKTAIWINVVRGSFIGNSALWFLFTFFIVKLFYELIHRKVKDEIIATIAFLTLIINYGLKCLLPSYSSLLSVPEYFYNSVSGIMFYALGHLLSKRQYEAKVFVVSILLYVAIAIFAFSYVDMYHNTLQNGFYFIWPISAVCGVISINNLAQYTNKFYSFPILRYIGRNSFVFFAAHFIIGNIDNILFIIPLGITDIRLTLFIYFLSFAIFLPLLCKLIEVCHFDCLVGKIQQKGIAS